MTGSTKFVKYSLNYINCYDEDKIFEYKKTEDRMNLETKNLIVNNKPTQKIFSPKINILIST